MSAGLTQTSFVPTWASVAESLRSTLADANEKHDWRIFADFAQILIQRAARVRLTLADPFGVELQNSAYRTGLEATIDLCLAMFHLSSFP